MTYNTMIRVDLAKSVFKCMELCSLEKSSSGGDFSRQHFCKFMVEQDPWIVVMEACGIARYWAREMAKLGH